MISQHFTAVCLSALLVVSVRAQQVEAYFEHCEAEIVKQITAAQNTIHVQAYNFTSAPIARALLDAGKRGLKVVVILDASNRTQKYSAADFLAHEGVETYIVSQHAIAHNKIIIFDGATVITGSFNLTKAAEENNAENIVVIRNVDLAAKYEANWQTHFKHSEYYAGK